MITQKEIAEVMTEEAEALQAFSKVSRDETDVLKRKSAARHRLMLARSAKAALIDDMLCA